MHLPSVSRLRRLAQTRLPLLGVICLGVIGLAGQAPAGTTEGADTADGIVGTWLVKAPDASLAYHMFVFNADGTMQQANPDAGDPDASDSDGKGIWVRRDGRIIGKFVEVSADRTTHKFASIGEISYGIDVSGDVLTGTASARFYDENEKLLRGPFATALQGRRVTLP